MICFKVLEDIATGKLSKSNFDEETLELARYQFLGAVAWLESLGVKTKYQKEFVEWIS